MGDGGHENEMGRQARRQEERQRGRIYERQIDECNGKVDERQIRLEERRMNCKRKERCIPRGACTSRLLYVHTYYVHTSDVHEKILMYVNENRKQSGV